MGEILLYGPQNPRKGIRGLESLRTFFPFFSCYQFQEWVEGEYFYLPPFVYYPSQ